MKYKYCNDGDYNGTIDQDLKKVCKYSLEYLKDAFKILNIKTSLCDYKFDVDSEYPFIHVESSSNDPLFPGRGMVINFKNGLFISNVDELLDNYIKKIIYESPKHADKIYIPSEIKFLRIDYGMSPYRSCQCIDEESGISFSFYGGCSISGGDLFRLSIYSRVYKY